jgi:hypothetical protein
MIVRNNAHNSIYSSVNGNRVEIKGGETKEVEDNLVQNILNSYRAGDLEILDRALDGNKFLRMEEV